MPKVLLYITAKIIWNFLFYNTDFHENRAHVHVGKRGMEKLCKIWLEPEVQLAKQGDLNDKQINEVLQITKQYKDKLLKQWNSFKEGKNITKQYKDKLLKQWNSFKEGKNIRIINIKK